MATSRAGSAKQDSSTERKEECSTTSTPRILLQLQQKANIQHGAAPPADGHL